MGRTINHILGIEGGSNPEYSVILSTLWFGLLSVIYFSIVQQMVYSDFGIPTMPKLVFDFFNPSAMVNFFVGGFSFIIQTITFSIPNVSLFLNLILWSVRIVSLLAIIGFIYEKVIPTK